MGGGREEQRKQDTRGRTEEVETKSDRKHTHTHSRRTGTKEEGQCVAVNIASLWFHIKKSETTFKRLPVPLSLHIKMYVTQRAEHKSPASYLTHTHREHSRKSNYVDKVNKHTVKTKFCL